MTLVSAVPEIERDRFGRPMIVPKGGGRPTAYTRTTTFVSACEDTFKLNQWSQRHAVKGVAHHFDLMDGVKATPLDDKDALNDLVDEARLRAGGSDSAEHGTYLHAVTEAYDRGLDPAAVPVPFMYGRPQLFATDYMTDLEAYLIATADLKHVLIEQMCVFDRWKVAGTPDRVVEYQGKRYIADLKSGNIEFGAGKIAAQLAMYARSEVYDTTQPGARGIHGAELDKGLVIWLPAGSGTCELRWIDLLAGWEIAKTCFEVRERRKLKARDLYAPFAAPGLGLGTDDLAYAIRSSATAEEVRALWGVMQDRWTDDLTAIARTHIATLEKENHV